MDYDQDQLWKDFQANGTLTVIADNGSVDVCTQLAFLFHDNDFPDHEDVNYGEMNFYAGFDNLEEYNIPDHIFQSMFAGVIPTGVKIEWNSAEQTHWVSSSIPFTVADAKAFIRPILIANGFVEL